MVSLGLLRSPLGGTMFGQQRVNTQHTFILISNIDGCLVYLRNTRYMLPISLLYSCDHTSTHVYIYHIGEAA